MDPEKKKKKKEEDRPRKEKEEDRPREEDAHQWVHAVWNQKKNKWFSTWNGWIVLPNLEWTRGHQNLKPLQIKEMDNKGIQHLIWRWKWILFDNRRKGIQEMISKDEEMWKKSKDLKIQKYSNAFNMDSSRIVQTNLESKEEIKKNSKEKEKEWERKLKKSTWKIRNQRMVDQRIVYSVDVCMIMVPMNTRSFQLKQSFLFII
jgi:hypothetical protein